MMSRSDKGKDQAAGAEEGSSSAAILLGSGGAQQQQQQAAPLSRYESQKRRDWNTFCQYLKNQRPPVNLLGGRQHEQPFSSCNSSHVLDFLRYLDQFGKTKVHVQGCPYFGEPEPAGPCACPLRQAWGSLDALIGRLRAAYEENGGTPDTNPFASGTIRLYLRDVRDSQAKARGVPYKKKKKKKKKRMKLSPPPPPPPPGDHDRDDRAGIIGGADEGASTTTSSKAKQQRFPMVH